MILFDPITCWLRGLRTICMDITCTPDLGVIVPPDDMPHATLRERAAAACKTIETLVMNGLDPEVLAPTPEDGQIAAELLNSYAKDEDSANKTVTTGKLGALRPAVILQLDEMLGEFSHVVVKNAVQIRTFVTNKLLLEANNPDGRIRIRALELLGKVSDVGLFTERSEVTVTHRSTDELRRSLREKLEVLRAKTQIQDVTDINTIPIADSPLQLPKEVLETPLVDNIDAVFGLPITQHAPDVISDI